MICRAAARRKRGAAAIHQSRRFINSARKPPKSRRGSSRGLRTSAQAQTARGGGGVLLLFPLCFQPSGQRPTASWRGRSALGERAVARGPGHPVPRGRHGGPLRAHGLVSQPRLEHGPSTFLPIPGGLPSRPRSGHSSQPSANRQTEGPAQARWGEVTASHSGLCPQRPDPRPPTRKHRHSVTSVCAFDP